MVRVIFDKKFQHIISKIKDSSVQNSIKNKVAKIIENPEIGKPMRHTRRGTREVYAGSFRLSYRYSKEEDLVEFLEFYHKDEQ
ncbi:type II toxin-antitoxin system RelE/ParE family toxin [Candidatus Pacearchaeota archaeon]|nr:type II toxin-antitoxin system RelE/ParE family toxin [Candidatus Pacearchaeota archaeon]